MEDIQMKRYVQTSGLVLGNCREVLSEYASNQIQLVVTSPPYFNQKECATGGEQQDGTYATVEDYFSDMESIYRECLRLLKPGGVFALNIGSDPTYDLRSRTSLLLQSIGLRYVDTLAWVRGTGNITRGFHIEHNRKYYPFLIWESIFIYRKAGTPKGIGLRNQLEDDFPTFEERFTDLISSHLRTNVWHIPQDNGVDHPAPYPIKLAYNLIACYSEAGSIILDPFIGSGTTAIAANQIGNRKYLGIELIKERYEYALRRIEDNNQMSLL